MALKMLCVRKAVLASFVFLSVQASVTADPVSIELRESSLTPAAIVKIGDLAQLSGGDSSIRRQISELDVIEITEKLESYVVSRALISIRLRIAGFDEDEFEITGAKEANVAKLQKRTLTDQTILNAIRKPLLKKWKVSEDELQIRLMKPISARSRQSVSARSNWKLKPFLNGSILPGTAQVRVGVYERDQLVSTVSVSIEATVTRTVPVAKRSISRGEAIDADSSAFESSVLRGADAINVLSKIDGRVATRNIRAGQPLTSRNTKFGEGSKKSDRVLVRRRALVTLVAHKGSLSVRVASAQALDQGKKGDVIRVKNLTSGKIVSGKIESEREVHVSF